MGKSNDRKMKIVLFILLAALCSCSLQSPFIRDTYRNGVSAISADSIVHTLFFIGDAGEPLPKDEEPTFRILLNHAVQQPKTSTIIFLGDNIYPKGLPDSTYTERREMERRLNEQIAIVEKSGAVGLFIPGNHDWEYQGSSGWETLRRQEAFIAAKNLPNVTMLPKGGFPGPSVLDIGDSIRIVALDTQWWLHGYEKPLYNGDSTEEQTKKRFLDSLFTVLHTARKTIVVAHHPIESHGEHGGFFDWRDHLFPLRKLVNWLWFPLPGIGSLYPMSRMLGISSQDFSNAQYAELRVKIDSVLSSSSPIAYVSGHEHTLQVLNRVAHHYYLVSGKGIQQHDEALTYGENTIFAHRGAGFMRIDVSLSGAVRLGVIEATEAHGNGVEVFSMMLR